MDLALQIAFADAVADHFDVAKNIRALLQGGESRFDRAGAEMKIVDDTRIAGSMD